MRGELLAATVELRHRGVARFDLPDGTRENENLALYTNAMQEVARQHQVPFVDVFNPSRSWFRETDAPLTIDGDLKIDAPTSMRSIINKGNI